MSRNALDFDEPQVERFRIVDKPETDGAISSAI
jgi:hypothetical protein